MAVWFLRLEISKQLGEASTGMYWVKDTTLIFCDLWVISAQNTDILKSLFSFLFSSLFSFFYLTTALNWRFKAMFQMY